MTQTVLIGLGAVGARVAVTALHLAAAGIGPQKLAVGLVEQDPLDPDLASARGLGHVLEQLHATLHGGANAEHGVSPDCPLGRAPVRLLGRQDSGVWRPAGPRGALLENLLDRPDAQQDLGPLLRTLFALSPTRQQALAAGGFDDDADLAAAAIAVGGASARQSPPGSDTFWGDIRQCIDAATPETPVRFLIAGAAFEALGACGLEMARHLRALMEESGVERAVEIGLIVLTPYFEETSADETVLEARRARAKVTLEHHAQILEDEALVDHVNVVGWRPLFQVHASAGPRRHQPASPPELFAALAVARAEAQPPLFAGDGEPEVRVSTRQTHAAIRWDDVDQAWLDSPQDAPDYARPASSALIQTLSFCMHWRARYSALLSTQAKKVMLRDRWFKTYCPKMRMTPEDEAASFFGVLDAYAAHMLDWASEMAHAAPATPDYVFGLWRAETLDAVDWASGASDTPPAGAERNAPQRLAPADARLSVTPSAPAVVQARLDAGSPSPGSVGLGGLVEALYTASVDALATAQTPAEAS